MRNRKLLLATLLITALLVSATAALAGEGSWGPGVFPAIISLPDGFSPEGIVSGYGADFYAGSLADGTIYKGDFRSGEGELLVDTPQGGPAVGLAFDERTGYLYVAGGPTGMARVYDSRSGMKMGEFNLSAAPTFVNDVIVTSTAAYFTDSFNARLYRLPLEPTGALPDPGAGVTLDLGGDWSQVGGFNANGIEATPDGKDLLVVNSSVGALYRVDPHSGEASLIDLGGASVSSGDGILLDGKTIYVLRNQLNEIAVIELAPDLSSGEVVGSITDENFDVPTTLTGFGSRLYAVNARFGTPVTPETAYTVVQVAKRPVN